MAIVNYWAVLVSAIVSLGIGSVWYGPLFGKLFMHEVGMDSWPAEKREAMKKRMVGSYIIQGIASFVLFYFVAGLIVGFAHTTLGGGIMTAFWIWVGFVLPVKVGDLIWNGKTKLFFLDIGHILVNLLVAGAIIGAWK